MQPALPEVVLSHAQTNQLIRAALGERWPAVRFYVRVEPYGDTHVYYVHGRAAPAREAVEQVVRPFAGSQLSGCDGWDKVAQTRTRADGQQERVWYGTRSVDVWPVALRGRVLFRRDGIKNLCDVANSALRRSLRHQGPATGTLTGRKSAK